MINFNEKWEHLLHILEFYRSLNTTKNLIRLRTRVDYYTDRKIRKSKFIKEKNTKYKNATGLTEYRACPLERSFHWTLGWRATDYMAFARSPHVCVSFPWGTLASSNVPKMLTLGSPECLNCPSLSEYECMCVPYNAVASSCPGVGPTLYPELQG